MSPIIPQDQNKSVEQMTERKQESGAGSMSVSFQTTTFRSPIWCWAIENSGPGSNYE